ncbi:hypothetical protein BB561_000518 [Smittium simulii]|uniref:7-dehydrocholesterol reductase n=1 Tax=Smittium simulii TaxID=133385 RepID=A0A2T9YYT7_9FUNG|nr:hypothetical protein BB561_000518 [Smittium simulii]
MADTKVAPPLWGRAHKISPLNNFITASILILSPFWVLYLWACCTHYNCAFSGPAADFLANSGSARDAISFVYSILPAFNTRSLFIYTSWLAFQAILFVYLPGKTGYGQKTPAGHLLKYKVNGLNAWIVTHVLFIAASLVFGYFPLSIIQEHWAGLLVSTNIFGLGLATFAYIKAITYPSYPADNKATGSFLYDYFMGIEHNPRIGDSFDFKLFFNGRPGIIAWTLINLSFAGAQYNEIGYVTNSMILLNILHAIYVVDFFYHEDWYLRTIDIAHDHFGYYLAWGDLVWLPFTYTLQSHYIYRNPINLSQPAFIAILAIGLAGYYIFRNANNQKDLARRYNGDVKIWGKKATVIRASYLTSDGKTTRSILLTCGFWGISRHFNYVGDLLMCFAFGASCGLTMDFIPYYYLFYMTVLLVHRINRDHARCQAKYGDYWTEYCKAVPYKLVPFVF